MIRLSCPNCGSNLEIRNDLRKGYCEFCGSIFALQDDEISLKEIEKEEVYEKACQLMAVGSLHFLGEAEKLFQTISGWKDADSKAEQCQAMISKLEKLLLETTEANRIADRARRRKKKFIALVLVASLVVIIVSWVSIKASIHNNKDVEVLIQSVSTKADDYSAFIYMDFIIKNNTGASIDYIKVTTRFRDGNGKNMGTITSDFGSIYGYTGSSMSLKSHESTIEETYLSESVQSMSTLFAAVYQNGLDGLSVSYEIVQIKWTDGTTYTR